MKKIFNISVMLSLFYCTPIFLMGQIKVGFVNSERIRTEYEEFKTAADQLQLEYQKIQFEYQEMLSQLDSLKEIFETQRLMSSAEWRKEKEKDISDYERKIQEFQVKKVGPEGEMFQKQTRMEMELHSKVKKAVDNVAISNKYDFIFDGVSLLYGKPTYDVTDDVLYELSKAISDPQE